MRMARAVFGRRLFGLVLTLPLALAIRASAFAAAADPEPAGAAAPVRHFRTATAVTSLRLNELVAGPARDWDGSGTFSSRDDEWVELANTGTAALELSGFFLTDGDTLPRLALTGTLAGGGHLVVFGKQSFDWEKANGYPSFGLSLGNSGDTVMLWQAAGGDTTLVDSYAYGSHEAAADRAVGRLPDGTGAWVLFDALDPYTGATPPPGTGCTPTPGATNVCATTRAAPVTWGRVKTLYR